MKLLMILAITIVAVSGRNILSEESARNMQKLKDEFKSIEAVIKANPESAAIQTSSFMNSIDAGIRSKITKDSSKIMSVIIDGTKTLGERFTEVAQIQQNTADLWKEASRKYNELHELVANNEVDSVNVTP